MANVRGLARILMIRLVCVQACLWVRTPLSALTVVVLMILTVMGLAIPLGPVMIMLFRIVCCGRVLQQLIYWFCGSTLEFDCV